jgi:hypothetical protein
LQTATTVNNARQINLSSALLGPKAVDRLLTDALTQLRQDQDRTTASATGKGMYADWAISVSRSGDGTVCLSTGHLIATEKDIEPTRVAMLMDQRVGKIVNIERSPLFSLIHFTLCPKGREVK